MRPPLDYALAYAERLGWRVLPLHTPVGLGCSCRNHNCKTIGKHPRNFNGTTGASTDSDQIRDWWKRFPDANVGIAMGGGLLAYDIDPRNGGTQTHEDVEDHFGKLPPTVHNLTGGGGHHYLFAFPVGLHCRKGIGAGIDLLGEGKLIVAEPSLHASGRRYFWEDTCGPGDIPVAVAPDWMLEAAAAKPAVVAGEATGAASTSFLARTFYTLGWVGRENRSGSVCVRCPWAAEHSDGRGQGEDASTVILPPTLKRPMGTFCCSHGHCAGRGTLEALQALPPQAIALAGGDDPDGLRAAVSLLTWGARTVA